MTNYFLPAFLLKIWNLMLRTDILSLLARTFSQKARMLSLFVTTLSQKVTNFSLGVKTLSEKVTTLSEKAKTLSEKVKTLSEKARNFSLRAKTFSLEAKTFSLGAKTFSLGAKTSSLGVRMSSLGVKMSSLGVTCPHFSAPPIASLHWGLFILNPSGSVDDGFFDVNTVIRHCEERSNPVIVNDFWIASFLAMTDNRINGCRTRRLGVRE
jgi:hypothetical protein